MVSRKPGSVPDRCVRRKRCWVSDYDRVDDLGHTDRGGIARRQIHHGKTRSKFQYRTPRVIARFGEKKAREVTPDAVRDFLTDLRNEELAASSINQCRTILCSVFSYAIRFEKYDKNPPTTGIRKGEILARKWTDIDLDPRNPCISVRITKNDEPKRIQLPKIAVDALRALPSYGHHEYVSPAKPNPRFKGNFTKPHAWDLGKRFRRVAKAAKIKDLRIHDLRHFTASTLTCAGVEDNIISLLTGHKSRELRRYQHLRKDLKRRTVDRIAKELQEAGKNSSGPQGGRYFTRPQKPQKTCRRMTVSY